MSLRVKIQKYNVPILSFAVYIFTIVTFIEVSLHSYNEIEVPMTATQAWYQRDINDIDSPLRSVHDDDDDERWEAEKFFTQSTYTHDTHCMRI